MPAIEHVVECVHAAFDQVVIFGIDLCRIEIQSVAISLTPGHISAINLDVFFFGPRVYARMSFYTLHPQESGSREHSPSTALTYLNFAAKVLAIEPAGNGIGSNGQTRAAFLFLRSEGHRYTPQTINSGCLNVERHVITGFDRAIGNSCSSRIII